MSTTEAAYELSAGSTNPVLGSGLLGVALGVVERFFLHFELPTLAVGLIVVGTTLVWFGDRESGDVGRALIAVGATSVVALQVLLLSG
ncbi:hypothetical protein ACFQJ5_18190 [Halomicroarcula sp. GCM10025324]|uniref:hypothetical protein n=1 Tax=Haloarcula TaxID=2237 RepID=UPI0023E79EE7|nr:hypothetical protein [Halomicroarcula sp. ZS-22-S1]